MNLDVEQYKDTLQESNQGLVHCASATQSQTNLYCMGAMPDQAYFQLAYNARGY